MAELTIRPDEIRDALANFVKSYDPGVAARDEIGTVVEAGDGIAKETLWRRPLIRLHDDMHGIPDPFV